MRQAFRPRNNWWNSVKSMSKYRRRLIRQNIKHDTLEELNDYLYPDTLNYEWEWLVKFCDSRGYWDVNNLSWCIGYNLESHVNTPVLTNLK